MPVNFFFSSIDSILTELGLQLRVGKHNADYQSVNGCDAIDDPVAQEAMMQSVQSVGYVIELGEKIFPQFGCPHIDYAFRQIKHWHGDADREWRALHVRSMALRDAITTELKEYKFYQYPKNKGQKLYAWKEEWYDSLIAFKGIEFDVFSATDCYALGHYTACVFHLMRVLEHGLRALAINLGLTFNIQQWQNIIDEIEAEITKQRKTLPRGVSKNERLQFLSEAAKEFFYFKNGWRNYVSHNRAIYDEHQALAAIDHVRTFMNHLAAQLSVGMSSSR